VFRFALRIVVVSLIVCLNWTGLSAVLNTIAYFSDSELSSSIYEVGSLDFSLRSGQNDFVPIEDMIPGSSVTRDIYIKKEGSLPFKYRAHSEFVLGSCNEDLYNALELKIWYNYYIATPTSPNYHEHRVMTLKYDGLLKNFSDFSTNPDDPDLQIPNPHPYFDNMFYESDEHWLYSQITLPNGASTTLQNKSCQFKFVFGGWQTDLPDPSSGFSDTEEIINNLTTGDWMPQVTVIYPNGGEQWYLVPDWCPDAEWCSLWCIDHGMNADCEYPIQWSAINMIGPDLDLLIDLHYSTDSGSSWMAQIANDTENDGIFWWKVPYDSSYISSNARIKATAIHQDYPSLTDWDMSNADFCPPLLTFEDLFNWTEPPEEGTSTEEIHDKEDLSLDEWLSVQTLEGGESPVIEEEPAVEEEVIDEENITEPEEEVEEETAGDDLEEEISLEETPEEGTTEGEIPEEELTEEPTEEPAEELVVEEIAQDEPEENKTTTGEVSTDEEEANPEEEVPEEPEESTGPEELTVEEESVVEEEPAKEEPTTEEEQVDPINETPADEEEPIIIPEDNPEEPENPEDE